MKHLRNRFSFRTENIKSHIHRHYEEDDDFVSNEAETLSNANSNLNNDKLAKRLNDLILNNNNNANNTEANLFSGNDEKNKIKLIKGFISRVLKELIGPIKLQSLVYLIWLAIVSLFYFYNVFSITYRFSFLYFFRTTADETNSLNNNNSNQSNSNINGNTTNNNSIDSNNMIINDKNYYTYDTYYIILDYVADLVYLADILAVKLRIKFIQNGLWVTDYKLMAKNYVKSFNCVVNVFISFFTNIIDFMNNRIMKFL